LGVPSVLGDGFHDGLGADEDAGFTQEVEAFHVDGTAVQGGDHDGEVVGLAELVLFVGDEAVLFFGKAEELRHGVIEEGFGDVFFVKCKVILEMRAEGFFVLLVAFAGETLNEAAIGEAFAGEAGEFRDGLAAAGDGDEVAPASEETHGEIEASQITDAAGVDGKQFRMEAAVINHDRKARAPGLLVVNAHGH